MENKKILAIAAIIINILGIICLATFAIPYITHDTTVANSEAMLAAEGWDMGGFALTIGTLPLIAANTLGFICLKGKKLFFRLWCYIPGAICFVLALSYLILS